MLSKYYTIFQWDYGELCWIYIWCLSKILYKTYSEDMIDELYILEFSRSYLKKFIIKKNDKFIEKRFMKV